MCFRCHPLRRNLQRVCIVPTSSSRRGLRNNIRATRAGWGGGWGGGKGSNVKRFQCKTPLGSWHSLLQCFFPSKHIHKQQYFLFFLCKLYSIRQPLGSLKRQSWHWKIEGMLLISWLHLFDQSPRGKNHTHWAPASGQKASFPASFGGIFAVGKVGATCDHVCTKMSWGRLRYRWGFDLLKSVLVTRSRAGSDITGTCVSSSNLIINSHSGTNPTADHPLGLTLLKFLPVITK